MLLVLAAATLLFLSVEHAAAAAPLSPANSSFSSTVNPHPYPDAVADQLVREVERLRERMLLAGGGDMPSSCRTGNPIDDCWRCDPDWQSNRKRLADCGIGFGRDAVGGRDGEEYVVGDPSDDDPSDPKPGTLRHAAVQPQPLWITFSRDMTIKLSEDLPIGSFKTIDGRGAAVHVTGAGCFYLKRANNVIIHNIHIHDCVKSKEDGDGITVRTSRDVWVDHCTLWSCHDGLIDVTHGSTAVTISNNHFHHHDKVMLLGHSDHFDGDAGMQVTVAFNRFGEALEQRMPRCRYGYFHVVNNDYQGWGLYAVGGSSNPTINSQGNRYAAPADDKKEVTKRMKAEEGAWREWNWRSQGDVMLNGAIFRASGEAVDGVYERATSMRTLPADDIDKLTMNAGVLGDNMGGRKGTIDGCGSGDYSSSLKAPSDGKNANALVTPSIGVDPGTPASGCINDGAPNYGIKGLKCPNSAISPSDHGNSCFAGPGDDNGQRNTSPWSWTLYNIFILCLSNFWLC